MNHCAVDKTMEETFIKHSKSHGGAGGNSAGLSGILTNHASYQRWVQTAHERSKFITMTFKMEDMLSNPCEASRNDVRRSYAIKKSEKCILKTMSAIKSFLNPLDVEDKGHLFSISSGAPASADVQKDNMIRSIRKLYQRAT